MNTLFIQKRKITLTSTFLDRPVTLTVLLPPTYEESGKTYPTLYLNDGQDFERLRLEQTLEDPSLPELIVVGIHANEHRLYEYGTAAMADYKGRGNLAAKHTDFVIRELIPYIRQHYRSTTSKEDTVIAGFSLGGLSALDIAWNHSKLFSKVGVFSGSLWWRSKAYEDGYDDYNDRIMHVQIRKSVTKPALKFWLEVGTHDEMSDRNNNGIIDAIDDTLDLIAELKDKGYTEEKDFQYVEVEGGRHDPETWGAIMPVFLKWAFAEK